MTFGEALDALKAGKRVARAGWNGKGMWLYLADYGMFKRHGEDGQAAEGPSDAFIVMSTAQHTEVPWLASQTDMLADDWGVVGRSGVIDRRGDAGRPGCEGRRVGMKLRDLHIGQYVHLQDTGIGCVVAVDAEYGALQPWKRQPTFVKVTVAMPPEAGANPLYSVTGRFAADGDFEGTEFPDLCPCAHVRIAEEAPAHATDAPAAEDAEEIADKNVDILPTSMLPRAPTRIEFVGGSYGWCDSSGNIIRGTNLPTV